MSRKTVWIDHHKAYILEYTCNGAVLKEFALEELERSSKDYQRKFYHQLAELLSTSEKLVVLGPGMAKEEFINHCESHHPQLAKSIIEVLTMKDHPRKFEILEASNACYRKYNAWTGT